MKAILLSIVILLAGASAYWGYSLGDDLATTGTKNKSVQDETKKKNAELGATETDLNNMNDSLAEAVKDQQNAAAQLSEAREKNSELTSEMESTQAEYAKIDGEMKKLVDVEDPRDPEQMVAEIDRLDASMKEKEAQMAEIATLTETTMAKLTPLETDYKKLRDRLSKYDSSVANNSKEYSITAVDPKWGFVIINAGTSSGLDPAVPLLVLRNGQRLAILQITQVEKNQTVADIVPSSIKPGNTLQVGDRVIPRRPQGQ